MHVENMCTLSPNYQDKLDRWFRMKHRWQCVLNGQSSPGILQVGQQPSYGTRQMPHTSPSLSSSTSSLPVSQRHCAMACQRFTVTFIFSAWRLKEGEACQGIQVGVYLHMCDRRVTSAKSLASIQIRPLDDIKEKLAFLRDVHPVCTAARLFIVLTPDIMYTQYTCVIPSMEYFTKIFRQASKAR